jgi:hypothetical protein
MTVSAGTRIEHSLARPRLLIGLVENDPIMGESLKQRLELEGYYVR